MSRYVITYMNRGVECENACLTKDAAMVTIEWLTARGYEITKTLRFDNVAELFVGCSLRVRNFDLPGAAASDNCQAPARYAAVNSEGRYLYRCFAHQHLITLDTFASRVVNEVSKTVCL